MISTYDGKHSITIGLDPIGNRKSRNTWTDWGLIPSTRPSVNMPEVKTNYIEVPGMNGSYDLTDRLTNYPTYGQRTGSWEFNIAHDYVSQKYGVSEDHAWHVVYESISNYLHGQGLRCILDDDPWYYYDGRFSVNQYKSDKHFSTITIDYTLEPYKWTVLSTGADDWPWDPFAFTEGNMVPTVVSYNPEAAAKYSKSSRQSIFKNILCTGDPSASSLAFQNVRANGSWNIPQTFVGSAPVSPTIYLDDKSATGKGFIKVDNSCTGVFTALKSRPSGWDTTEWGQYYEDRGYHFVMLSSLYTTAPAFIPGKYYIRAGTSNKTYELQAGWNTIPEFEIVCPTSDDWTRIAICAKGYVTIDFRIGRL